MHKTCKEYHCKGCTVIFDEYSNVVLEEGTGANDATKVTNHEHEKSHDNGEVECLAGSLPGEDLNALLEVNEGNVEAEDVAGEASHVFQAVTRVGDGEDPVHYQRPPEK